MARAQRDGNLMTWSARETLEATHEPYWHIVRRGLAIGYRKGPAGGTWWLREYRDGKMHKRRAGLADDGVPADGETVLAWRDVLRVALGEARPTVTVPTRCTVGEALSAYFEHRRAKARSTESLAIDAAKLRAHVGERLRARIVNSLTADDLRRWRDALVPDTADREKRRAAQASANRVRTVLFAALELAYLNGRATSNDAWRRVPPFRDVDRARTRFLSVAEAKRLLNALPRDAADLARGALYTGMRLGELITLRVTDCHDGSVWARGTKSGRDRSIPLSGEGAQFFEALTAGKAGDALVFTGADGSAWTRMRVSRHMAAACKAAKITPTATFHDLRRSYASLLLNQGAEAEVIQELLGHADLRMTRRAYAHLMQATVAKVVKAKLPNFGLTRGNVRKLRP